MKLSRNTQRLTVGPLAIICALLLAACASTPDPEETIEQLTSVTAPPDDELADDPYDFETNPLPTVPYLECSDYLVITARGTGEPSKGQLLSPVARAISEARPGQVLTVDLDYPADDDVHLGSKIGARLLVDTINQQTARCPDQEFVLLGYSQGALIIGDVLVSPDQRLVGETVGQVRADGLDRIIAIVFYGNPRFVAGEPFDHGSYVPGRNGILPRAEGELLRYADRIRDYCEAGDFVCQGNVDLEIDVEPHMSYYSNGMQQDGAAFVITQLEPMRTQTVQSAADER